MKKLLILSALFVSGIACGAPVDYKIDPAHTYPSFEADHMGVSIWRGKFNKNAGNVTLDKEKGEGTVDITIDLSSVDFGLLAMNNWAISSDFFDIPKYPEATYKGKLAGFTAGAPTQVVGNLTLHGITKPVNLKINSFKCVPHPMFKRELCGADVSATFNREEFGLDAGKAYGFRMDVTLRIQVEALATR